MAKNQWLKSLVGSKIKEFKKMTSGTLKERAWKVSENLPDWQRRMIYGQLLSRFQILKERKSYEMKMSNNAIETIAEMKGDII